MMGWTEAVEVQALALSLLPTRILDSLQHDAARARHSQGTTLRCVNE